jgi:hypothetical protein
VPDLTDDDLTELRRLHSTAQPTPWYVADNGELYDAAGKRIRTITTQQQFIEAAVNALPGLLAEVERLRAEALFVPGDFVAHSGDTLRWKIECDALTDRDWEALALAAIDVLPPFGGVEGVPTGGDPFARALAAHSTPGGPLLIADDVCTTGTSLDEHRAGRDAIGVVAFARGPIPDWVTPLFTLRAAAPASEDDRWVDLLTRADERANPDEERMYADEDADLIQELAAALRVGSPPPTPAPTREQVAAMVDTFVPASPSVMPYFEGIRGRLIDAVLALLSEPAPPSWTGETRPSDVDADQSYILARLPVPPGTTVEVREKRP